MVFLLDPDMHIMGRFMNHDLYIDGLRVCATSRSYCFVGVHRSDCECSDLANEREESASPVQYLAPSYPFGHCIGVPGAGDRDLVASPAAFIFLAKHW